MTTGRRGSAEENNPPFKRGGDGGFSSLVRGGIFISIFLATVFAMFALDWIPQRNPPETQTSSGFPVFTAYIEEGAADLSVIQGSLVSKRISPDHFGGGAVYFSIRCFYRRELDWDVMQRLR